MRMMTLKHCCAGLAVLCLCAAIMATAAKPAKPFFKRRDLDKAMPRKLTHPYLYFSKSDIAQIRKNIRNDPRCAEVWQRLIQEGKRFLIMPMPAEPPRQRIGRYDNDNVFNGYHRLLREAAFKLSFLYAVTGEKKYLDKARQFADAFCLLPTWVFRAHEFPVIEGRIWPWGVDTKRDQVVFSFDHVVGDATREMAAVYDWLYPGLTRVQRNRIRSALLENAILRVRNAYEYHWWAWSFRCNWTGVCNAGLGLAALAIYNENPEMLDVVLEAGQRIGWMMDEIGQDGGWQEGMPYWHYALRTSLFFMDALKRATKGKINLFKHPKLKNTFDFPLYTALPGKTIVNFCDAGNRGPVGSFSLYNKFSMETKSPVAAYLTSRFSNADSDPFSLVWNRTPVAPKIPKPEKGLSKHFRTIDWVILRTQWEDENAPVLAAKAGIHDDPHHGHLDAGSFLVNYMGETLIKDLGKPKYDEEAFDTARWTIPLCNSLGHNVVFVNGEEQMSGARYFSKVETFRPGKAVDYVKMDLSKTYPGKHLKKWVRHIVFHKPGLFLILDEVKSASGARIECRFHPGGEFTLEKKRATIVGEHSALGLAVLSPGKISLASGMHHYLPMQLKAEMREFPYIRVLTRARKGATYILTLIAPAENGEQAKALCEKGTASQSKDALTYTIEAGNKKVGGKFVLSPKGAIFQKAAD